MPIEGLSIRAASQAYTAICTDRELLRAFTGKLLKHFGITTVEAMSAGAVPVVIDSGGQRETVDHEVNGFRWSELTELQNYTRRIAGDLNLRKALSENAVISPALPVQSLQLCRSHPRTSWTHSPRERTGRDDGLGK